MLYCERCKGIAQDGARRCPNCKNPRLRPLSGDDMVFLQRADLYTANLLSERFAAEGIEFEALEVPSSSFTYDSTAMPTDKNISVRYDKMERAEEIAREVSKEVERETGEDVPETRTNPKRIVFEILMVVIFISLVMLAVFGADTFANWLKNLFGR